MNQKFIPLKILQLAFVLVATGFGMHAQGQSGPPAFIKISGEVTKPLSLTATDLASLKSVQVKQKGHDEIVHEFTGVNMYEVLGLAGVPLNKQLKGPNLAKYMLVKCGDGYQVLFSLAEVDSSLLDHPVILAYEADHKPIPPATGPFRLVVPGEKKQARSSYQVREIVIRSAKE